MESFKDFQLAFIPITLVILSLISVNGQIGSPCTTSMVSSFTPCISFITGSTNNGSSPTKSCCDSFKELLGNGMDCACLLVTGNVPIQLPINRTLALSLPQACKTGGVPLQCKASASPIAAPGPALLGPTLGPTPSPTSASALSPRASKAVATAPSPQSGTADDLQPESPSVEPESPSVEPEAPTQSTTPSQIGRSTPLPSASSLSNVSPPSLLLIIMGIVVFKSY